MWSALAQVMVGLHYAFLGYLVVGGFIAWRWRWTIVTHVLTAIWAILIVTTKVPCPLTALQNNFRERAGEQPLAGGFISHYVTGTLYPTDAQLPTQLAVGVVVLVSWVGYARLVRRDRVARAASGAPRGRTAATR